MRPSRVDMHWLAVSILSLNGLKTTCIPSYYMYTLVFDWHF